MATQTDIFNRALTLLGEPAISSPQQDIKSARSLSAIWDTTRQAELAYNRWTFAMKRAQLAADATNVPLFDYGAAFPFPSDCIAMHQVNNLFLAPNLVLYAGAENAPYAIEGRAVLTNTSAPLNVRYIRDVTDTTQYPPLFVDALAARLAIDAARAILGEDAPSSAQTVYKLAVMRAMKVNAIERPIGSPQEEVWVAARIGDGVDAGIGFGG